MCSKEVFINWDNHHDTLVKLFEQLLESTSLVDCTLAAEGQYIKAHKLVLSACSSFFQVLFNQESEKNPIVVFTDIRFRELKCIIDYMYHGHVKIPEDQLDHFMESASSLQIRGLDCAYERTDTEKRAREFLFQPTRQSKDASNSQKRKKKRRLGASKENTKSARKMDNTNNERNNSATLPVPAEKFPLPVETLPLPVESLPLSIETLPLPVQNLPLPVETLPLPVEVWNLQQEQLQSAASVQSVHTSVLGTVSCANTIDSSTQCELKRIKTESSSSTPPEVVLSVNLSPQTQGSDENELQPITQIFLPEVVCSDNADSPNCIEGMSVLKERVPAMKLRTEDMCCDPTSEQSTNQYTDDPGGNRNSIPQAIHQQTTTSKQREQGQQPLQLEINLLQKQKRKQHRNQEVLKTLLESDPQIQICNTYTCKDYSQLPNGHE